MKTISKIFITLLLSVGLVPGVLAEFDVGSFKFRGYVRDYHSINLEDIPETVGVDDKGDISMNRQVFFLEGFGSTGPVDWTGRFRVTSESTTNYEERLQTAANGLWGISGRSTDFDHDEYDEFDVRELFFDFAPSDRINLRIGRQQVVWGETDFFHATDVIHGYDFRWRNFYVPENEDVRKPLILLNGEISVPELDGSLQVIVRPSADREEWIGNSIPTFGGRWSNNGGKGFPLATNNVGGPAVLSGIAPFASATFNYHHDEGDTDDAHYGLRWTGLLGANDDIDYSLMYYHGQGGFQTDPILTLDLAAGDLQFIFPETDTFGASVSGYLPWLDITYRAEVAYTPDRVFSSGAAGLGLVEKDAYNILLGFDTNPRLQKWIGTSSPSLWTMQVFDWYLPDVEESDFIGNFSGSGVYNDHNVLMTSIFTLPYLHDTLIGTLVVIADLSEGGAFIIPSLEYQWGPHWRFKVEADLTVGGRSITNPAAPDGSIVGGFENNNQLLFRTTYQF